MNYFNTFIAVAADCPVAVATVPTRPAGRRSRKPAHLIQYELLNGHPYRYTQEDVLWQTHVEHKALTAAEATAQARARFFAKGQPCLRASALAKRYGWGFHFDPAGKVALAGLGSAGYERHQNDPELAQLLAMRNRRAS